jgi:hypothetical protein
MQVSRMDGAPVQVACRPVRSAGLLLILIGAARADAAPWGWTWSIPAKWSSVEGSPAVTDPGNVGEATTKDVLWRRHERVTDCVFGPAGDISLRSAAVHAIPIFPVVDDPIPPADGGPGVLGDITHPCCDTTELCLLANSTQAAWDELGLGGVGINIVNVRRFVNLAGCPASCNGNSLLGIAYIPVDLCGEVLTPLAGSPLSVFVTDNAFTFPGSPLLAAGLQDLAGPGADGVCDWVLAHEVGHALSLFHGNGIDTDGDGVVGEDPFSVTRCNGTVSNIADGANSSWDCGDMTADEDGAMDTLTNIMHPTYCNNGTGNGVNTTAAQNAAIVAEMMTIPGIVMDPPEGDVFVPIIMDSQADAIHEDGGEQPQLDISLVTVGEMVDKRMLFGTVELAGAVHPNEVVEAWTALDLDRNAATGGDPASELGLAMRLRGIELLVGMQVMRGDPPNVPQRLAVAVLRHANQRFQRLQDDRIIGRLGQRILHLCYGDDPRLNLRMQQLQLGHILAWELPLELAGPHALQIRSETITRRPGANEPAADSFVSLLMTFELPQFPQCMLEPFEVSPGDEVKASAFGLNPDDDAMVLVGDDVVGSGRTDAGGDVVIVFRVPAGTPPGPRLVTIGTSNAALTSDCRLIVRKGQGGRQRPGDCNQDVGLDISDVVCLLRHLFQGMPRLLPCTGGTIRDPGNRALLNSNGDATVDLSDAIWMLSFLFGGGPPPVLGTGCVDIAGCPEVTRCR